ncbi:hypothetical protein [uncultured Roseobacter sp.]|uniref:hypothetical protein n=1 Tax=uncultured Roseobacter sp. TaxID=114847 RepID=UPI00262919B6|nr:hypothetical protein [uncultured Roseobacter sp.]
MADPIIAALSARLSPKDVRKFVEKYYSIQKLSLREQIGQARYNKPSKPAYPARFNVLDGHAYAGQIICGNNPFIEAFRADGVCVDEETDQLVWDQESINEGRLKFSAAVKNFVEGSVPKSEIGSELS